MKNRKALIGVVLGIAVLVIVVICLWLNWNREYCSIIAIGCDATQYEQEGETGYLTIVITDVGYQEKSVVVPVTDVELQSKLAETDMTDIIGAQIVEVIPYRVLEEYHMNVNNETSGEILSRSELQEYKEVTEIYLKDAE